MTDVCPSHPIHTHQPQIHILFCSRRRQAQDDWILNFLSAHLRGLRSLWGQSHRMGCLCLRRCDSEQSQLFRQASGSKWDETNGRREAEAQTLFPSSPHALFLPFQRLVDGPGNRGRRRGVG